MIEFFADSLLSGFFQSSMMGKVIVLIQLLASMWMLSLIIGKWLSLSRMRSQVKRLVQDIMSGKDALEYYLSRRSNEGSPIEKIYNPCCDRLLRLFSSDVRSALAMGRIASAEETQLTAHEVELVKSICDHALDEQEIAIDKGMPWIATIVTLAPMLGLLGTVWGVLDAFADMGAAGSATIATMAPAISSALVTTVVGLLVAIPGACCHAGLLQSSRRILADLEAFSDELMGRIALEYEVQGK